MNQLVEVFFYTDQQGNVIIKIVDHNAKLIMQGQVTIQQFKQVADRLGLQPAPKGAILH